MKLSDVVLVLLLAARIHGTDEAVRASARRCVKKLPRSQREVIYDVINSHRPMDQVALLADALGD